MVRETGVQSQVESYQRRKKWYLMPSCLTLNIIRHRFGLMRRVFTNGPGDRGSIPGRVIPKTQKMVLDTALLNTQHYKVKIKGKVEQSREWSSALPYSPVWYLLKRDPSGHPRLKSPTLLYLEQSRRKGWCPPLCLCVVTIEKEALESSSITVGQLTLQPYIYIYIGSSLSFNHVWLYNKDTFCLYNFI